MKIGILGSGNIGGNLGRRWSEKGHTIQFGVRDPNADDVKKLLSACKGAQAVDVKAAAQFGDVVVIALPWGAVADVLKSVGSLSGKTIVDATNALKWGPDGPEPAVDSSGAQKVQELATGAHVVKCFNTLGAEHILSPTVGGQPADAFLCGDDAGAKSTVKKLAEDIGFRALDLGPLKNARTVEHIAIAWIYLAMKGGLGRNVAFKVVG
jgi:NADPH-dependent F420 reductase